MTPLVAEVRARLAAATPGPWIECEGDVWSRFFSDGSAEIPLLRADMGIYRHWGRKPSREEVAANVDLAAAAPTDLARLCDRVEELERALRDVDEWLMIPWTAEDVKGGAVHPLFRKALLAVRAALGEKTP